MNLVGHNYIANKVLGHVSANTFLGSHIPDFVPFLPSSIFSFQEIHENHENFLKFIEKKHPEMSDLPLSMMCHSVKYGADEYNRVIDDWLLSDKEKLTDTLSSMIAESSNITYETARGPRLHNYLWCGVDLFLIKNNPNNITAKLIGALEAIDYSKTSEVLAEFYGKDKSDVESNLREYFKYIKLGTFQDIEGFTMFWSRFLSPLKEGDNLDVTKGTKLLEFIYREFKPRWVDVMDRVVTKVEKKMKPCLN